VYIPWDIEKYATHSSKPESEFPPIKLGYIDVPATIVDIKGRIIFWYLPGIILPPHQVCGCHVELI
jgi:hypothetical protein